MLCESAQELGYGDSLELDLMEIYIQTGRYRRRKKSRKTPLNVCAKDDDDCRALTHSSAFLKLNGLTARSRQRGHPWMKRVR